VTAPSCLPQRGDFVLSRIHCPPRGSTRTLLVSLRAKR
jgi:hypothetical protein